MPHETTKYALHASSRPHSSETDFFLHQYNVMNDDCLSDGAENRSTMYSTILLSQRTILGEETIWSKDTYVVKLLEVTESRAPVPQSR